MRHVHIEVDADLCVGSGECVALVPHVFLLGPTDVTVTVRENPAHADVQLLQDAAQRCPTGAIRLLLANS